MEAKRKREGTAATKKADKKTKIGDQIGEALKILKVDSIRGLKQSVSEQLILELETFAEFGENKTVRYCYKGQCFEYSLMFR